MERKEEGLAGKISQFVKEVKFEDFTGEAVYRAKAACIDCTACIIAGTGSSLGKILIEYAGDYSGPMTARPSASVLGTKIKTMPEMAALINGSLGHVLDFDDVSPPMIGHPSVTLLPVVMALGEVLRSKGRDVLAAYLCGFEIEARLGRFFNPSHYAAGWHSTGTIGTLGAAAAGARVLGLSSVQIEMAMGIAASLASGLKQNFGTMTKPFHGGKAAQDGIRAAVLAQKGLTSNPSVFEGDKGFLDLFSIDKNAMKSLAFEAKEGAEILQTGVTLKKHACCAGTHTAVDAVLKIVLEEDIKPEEIKEIRCRIHPLAKELLYYSRPENSLQAKFSMEYALAVAAAERKAGIKEFSDEMVQEPRVRSMLERMIVQGDPGIENVETGVWASTVSVVLTSGQEYYRETLIPRGNHKNPLSEDELRDKFLECTGAVLKREKALKVLDMMWTLETQSSLTPLMELLT